MLCYSVYCVTLSRLPLGLWTTSRHFILFHFICSTLKMNQSLTLFFFFFRWFSTKCPPMRPCSWRAPTRSTRTTSPAAHLSTSRSGISRVKWISLTPPSTMRWSFVGPGRWYLSLMLRWGTGRTSGSCDVAVNTGSDSVVSRQHTEIVC